MSKHTFDQREYMETEQTKRCWVSFVIQEMKYFYTIRMDKKKILTA